MKKWNFWEIKWYILELYLKGKRPAFHLYLFDTRFTKPFNFEVLHFIICKSVVLNQKTISSLSLFDWRKKQASLRTSVRTSDLPLGLLTYISFTSTLFFPAHLLLAEKYSGVRAHEVFTELLSSCKVCGDFYNLPFSLTSTKIPRPFPFKLCFQLAIRNKYLNELSSRLPSSQFFSIYHLLKVHVWSLGPPVVECPFFNTFL